MGRADGFYDWIMCDIDQNKFQSYKMGRADGSNTLHENPVGMTHFMAMDFNPLETNNNPIGMIRFVEMDIYSFDI
jgi:hypothetical protein